MNRRTFLAALFAAPVLPLAAKVAQAPAPRTLSGVAEDLHAFHVDGTAVRMSVADIGAISAGKIRSSSGKAVIDLDRSCITISA